MTTAPKSSPALTPEQLSEVLPLIKGAGGVELKLTVPDLDHQSAVAALEMDVLDAQIRQVVFFDTPALELNANGVVVRVRRVQGKPGDCVVKLRPVVPDAMPAKLRKSPAFGIEVDAMPGGFVCSGSMKATVDDSQAKAATTGRRPLSKLFTKDQRQFFTDHAPAELSIDGLAPLGPINILKLKFRPGDLDRKMVAELWFYPDGTRILELSTKCAPGEAFDVAARTKSFLADRGIDLSGRQQTKTKTALTYFARLLAPAPADASGS